MLAEREIDLSAPRSIPAANRPVRDSGCCTSVSPRSQVLSPFMSQLIFDPAQLDSLRSCEPIELSWSGWAPPYGLSSESALPDLCMRSQGDSCSILCAAVIPTNTLGALMPLDLGKTNKPSFTWDVAFPAGANLMIAIDVSFSAYLYACS